MTYEELKVRLTSVETTLQQLQTTESAKLTSSYIEDSIQQLNIVRENLLSKMKILEEGDETMFVSTKGGDTKAVKMDRKTAMDLKKDPAITGIDTAKGAKIKEAEGSGIDFSIDETKAIAKSVGKALIITLKKLGDEIARIKAHRIEENSFDVYVEYKGARAEKGHGDDEFSFYIKEDSLHLVDFSFDKELVEVGVKPSGEAIVNVDVLSNELLKHFKSLNEEYNPDQEQKDDEEDHGVGYDDEGRPLGEGEGDDHHYIKVKAHDYKKAMAILDQNVDPTYVKMEVVDNDGAGNVIIYFIFKHEDGFDDMYDDSENPDSEFYQEPDEDPQAFVYDVVMDLRANDIELADHSADMDEATNFNDPVLMKMRVAKKRNADFKKLDAYSKSPEGRAAVRAQASAERKEQKAREVVRKLKIKRAQVEREMENDPDIESTGGPVADMYGDQLNKIDNAIEKAASIYNKPMDYDTAVGKVNEEEGHLVTFGYDLDAIQSVVDHLQSKYKEGQDFELHIGRGDDLPNAVTLKNPALEKDYDLNDMLNAAQSDQDRYDAYTDYDQRRREEDDYYEDPDYYKESKNIDEIKAAKIQKAHSKVVSIMKDLAKKYKAGDKSVVDQLKTLTITKKKLEAELDRAVAGTHHSQELDEKSINEYAARDLDEIFGALGYRQGFDEFIDDNPGCVEVIMEWIGSIRDFQQKLSQEYDNEELENLGFYFGDDDMYENVNESLNPEVSKKVDQFIKAMAKRYGYEEQDAVYAIMAALKQREFDGVAENKETLKEFTDNRFKGSDVIDDANERGPDMFGKGIFADLLPKGVASENDAIEALKAHDKSPIKARMGRYAPMFVHVQYHELEHEGEDYRMHQTQYYNSNFKDKDPSFNPGVSKITLFKITKKAADRRDREETDQLGTIIVKTDQYVQDLRNLPGLGKRVSENLNELDADNSKALVKKAVADINGAMFKFRHSNPLKMIAAKDKDLKVKLDSMHNAIFDLEKVLKAKDLFEATRKDLGIGSSVSKRRAKAELKNPGKDGSKVYGLDKDGKRVHIKSINDVDKFKKFELDADLNEARDKYKVVDKNGNEVAGPDAKHIMVAYAKKSRGWKAVKVEESVVTEAKGGQIFPGDYVKTQHGDMYMRVDGKVGKHDAYVRVIKGKVHKRKTALHHTMKLTVVNKDGLEEAGPGFKHDCAAKVIHKEHGTGNCIPEKHTLVKEGKKYVVTHYDVLFESGKTVTDIPVSELEIKTQNEHWHKGYKKKKK